LAGFNLETATRRTSWDPSFLADSILLKMSLRFCMSCLARWGWTNISSLACSAMLKMGGERHPSMMVWLPSVLGLETLVVSNVIAVNLEISHGPLAVSNLYQYQKSLHYKTTLITVDRNAFVHRS